MEIAPISKNSLVILVVVIVITFSLLYLKIEISDKKDKEFRALLLEDRQTQKLQNYTLNEIGEVLFILENRFNERFLNMTLENFAEQTDSNKTIHRILEEVRELKGQ